MVQYQIRQDNFTIRPYGLDYCHLFPIAWLNLLSLPRPSDEITIRGDKIRPIKSSVSSKFQISDSRIPCSRPYCEKVEPRTNYLWIFVLGSLVIVRARPTRPELWLSLYEVASLVRPDARRVTCLAKQSWPYPPPHLILGKPLLIWVETPSDTNLLIERIEIPRISDYFRVGGYPPMSPLERYKRY